MGNPSFEELLQVPLVITPPVDLDASQLLAAAPTRSPPDLEPQEQLLTEMGFLTYRRGPWKSFTRRRDDALVLVDLRRDPHETADVSSQHEQIAEKHRARVSALRSALTGPSIERALSEEEKARLRALGYLDE